MEDEKLLMARLATFSDGASSWVERAREQDFDEDAIEHVEEAKEHVRGALEILDEK
ncbi:hypothetical protein BDK61_1482 [Haloarcula quadrata]|uniref:Uncharacterized protein n=1 Tax=Haloarcula quadrata TaxID=182779 RepID=A0A495R4J6_9EURY|nr:hypothetical protein [Haloarcula quadrata]RKS82182.1 hypothetical protein BDK61_1482 [Haloarcula quadrata]